jgi:hypothetical protein
MNRQICYDLIKCKQAENALYDELILINDMLHCGYCSNLGLLHPCCVFCKEKCKGRDYVRGINKSMIIKALPKIKKAMMLEALNDRD